MKRRLLVTSHCQVGGLASALSALCSDVDVEAMPLTDFPSDDESARELVGQYDIWISSRRTEILQGLTRSPIVAMCPEWHFTAFHPDIVYIINGQTNEALPYSQASRIASWGYNAGLDAAKTASLFNSRVFSRLGYFDIWEPSIEGLRKYFETCQLEFIPFYLAIKRAGIFMYDPGHPHSLVLVEVAKALARKLGLRLDPTGDYKIPEMWEHIAWPVYPEIADQYGAYGSYTWTEGGPIQGGLHGYINHIFGRFHAHGLLPGHVSLDTAAGGRQNIGAVYDQILLPFSG